MDGRGEGIARYGDGNGLLAVAHRGGSGLAPENTMTAFSRSWALGLRYLETDLRLTADGACVLFHDARTRRLTGRPGTVARLTWDQVRPLRIAGREPIPRLEELLSAWPDARICVDLKDPRAIGRLAAVIRAYRAHDRVCLVGTADRWLADARAVLGGRVATALGWESTARLVAAARFGHRPRGIVRAPYVHVPLRLGRVPVYVDRLITMAREQGCRLVVWTVDEPAVMRRLLSAGVDGIITDRPDLLREVLVAHGSWRPGPALPAPTRDTVPG
ncbi:MAG TPA: glycerophosphodiester phosphodiesterase family protein [Kineosporiaceae bacterium]|nr:glycerophosphodiester phosphodiesterase family protein [Kineosporiaceae bacterium]